LAQLVARLRQVEPLMAVRLYLSRQWRDRPSRSAELAAARLSQKYLPYHQDQSWGQEGMFHSFV
jgi:hypothetical protein